LSYRFRKAALGRMLRLTDAFIWEDLPRTDRDTGSLTMAAWIPRVQRMSFFITSFATTFHVIQSSVRLLISEDRPMLYGTWYPFDTTKSPTYELTNIAQVRISGSSEIIIYCFFYCVEQNKISTRRGQHDTRSLYFRSVSLCHCVIT
jgi:hypothetical protein